MPDYNIYREITPAEGRSANYLATIEDAADPDEALALYRITLSAQELATNPGFETDTTGWSTTVPGAVLNAGATLTRDLTTDHTGDASGKVVTTAGSTHQGIATPLVGTFHSGILATPSVWLKGNAGGEAVDVFIGNAAGTDLEVSAVSLTTSFVEYPLAWEPSADRSDVYLGVRSTAAAVLTFFTDDWSAPEEGSLPIGVYWISEVDTIERREIALTTTITETTTDPGPE